MMMQRLLVLAVPACLACSQQAKSDRPDSASNTVSASAAGSVEPAVRGKLPANRMGRIPVLEIHVVRDQASGEFVIARSTYEHVLQTLYDRGYRPITVAQLLDRDFRDVPAGMSPVVFTFDDASPEQFSYIERNGQLEIDPKSEVGIWMAFNQQHPDWKPRATFCLLPGAAAGHAFFGDNPKWNGQKKEWRFRKVKWLADNGFEICNHTLWHAQLNKFPDAFVQEQIVRGAIAIDSAVPGYKIRTFALPQGLWPKNRALAWRGSWTNPKTHQTTSYDNETVLEVSGGPVRSPFDPQFDKTRITRFIVSGNALDRLLDQLDKPGPGARFVWDGGSGATAAR
jgi:peptidoglycan/xylan/chitin deacetylase (PgdA/CDA1 family)